MRREEPAGGRLLEICLRLIGRRNQLTIGARTPCCMADFGWTLWDEELNSRAGVGGVRVRTKRWQSRTKE